MVVSRSTEDGIAHTENDRASMDGGESIEEDGARMKDNCTGTDEDPSQCERREVGSVQANLSRNEMVMMLH